MEDTGTTLRGRVRAADQIARWSGLPLPLELRYDEFSIDIPENQLVLGATRVLLRLPLVPPATRSRLLRIRGALDGVTPLALGPPVQEPLITRLNARYAAAMRLAALILRSAGVSTTRGGVSSTAFVFDMNAVFEDFLTRALGDAVRRHGARLVSQDTSQQLDYQRRIRLKPDMTVWQGGTCRAVLDAKYKPLTTPGFPNADAYQMLAYCTAFGLNRGSLVYAKDEINAARMHSVRNTDVKICVEALDVTLDPNELLAQVDALAGQLLSAREASSR
jgi:5-methylcytosine-specific restriction enzyme subunit McrC